MKVLVIGSGGREHAIIWKLKQSPLKPDLYCAPGNAGISRMASCVPISATDVDGLLDFALKNEINFTVVGMEDPLTMGIVDRFEEKGLRIYGPRRNAAVIESSKAFSKAFMKRHNIPTADYEVFDNYEDALDYVKAGKFPVVVKADGLAVGKGVYICKNAEEAQNALDELMIQKKFGGSGDSVVIEEFMTGPEVSVLAFCDGNTLIPMVSAQDYKKAYDHDLGPNTGGMGARSPAGAYSKEMERTCMASIFMPTVKGLLKEGRPFVGTLYFGLMITADGPKVIEYNARFGDPETQVVLPRLQSDLLEIFMKCQQGGLEDLAIEWTDAPCVCVILASGGYPMDYEKGYEITGIDDVEADESILVFHAGTGEKNGKLVTAGGRVLGVTACGQAVENAAIKAYQSAGKIHFDKMHYRNDIGK